MEEAKHCPTGFKFNRIEDHILIYRIVFDSETHFPSIKECIRIDRNLHVQLECDGNPLPLPHWFVHGLDTMLNSQDSACWKIFPNI